MVKIIESRGRVGGLSTLCSKTPVSNVGPDTCNRDKFFLFVRAYAGVVPQNRLRLLFSQKPFDLLAILLFDTVH